MNRFYISALALLAAAMPMVMDSALKGAALLAVAAVAALALWRASAAARHLVWLVAVLALLLVPVLSVVLPGWRVLPAWAVAPVAQPVENRTYETYRPHEAYAPAPVEPAPPQLSLPAEPLPPPATALPAPTPAPIAAPLPPTPITLQQALPALWISGCGLLLVRLFSAHWLLRRASRRCQPATEDRRTSALAEAAQQLGVRQRIRFLVDEKRTIPVVWGVIWPRLILPAEALSWDDAKLRSVLLHELAHIRRRDTLVQWLTQLACALHWFNPLVWLAAWRLHTERERACDDLVLASGVKASAYAGHLLDVASKLTPARWTSACGLAMARKSSLESRLRAVLSGNLNRRGVTRLLALAAVVLTAAVVVPLAMLRAAEMEKPKSINDLPSSPGLTEESQAEPPFGDPALEITQSPQLICDATYLPTTLKPETESKLAWGKPDQGLRAALVRLSPPGPTELGQVLDFNLVIQNVSLKPIKLSMSCSGEHCKVKAKDSSGGPVSVNSGFIECGIASTFALENHAVLVIPMHSVAVSKQVRLLQTKKSKDTPSEAPVVPVMWPAKTSDPVEQFDNKRGRKIGSYVSPEQEPIFIGDIKLPFTSREFWNGHLITGDSNVAEPANVSDPSPKTAASQSLFNHWKLSARANGKIPGGCIAQVAASLKTYMDLNAGTDYATKCEAVFKKCDASHDWNQADAAALLDEIETVAMDHAAWTMRAINERQIHPGKPLPDKLKDAPWGTPANNGLRMAWLCGTGVPPVSPEAEAKDESNRNKGSLMADGRDAHATLNSILTSRILFHNTGKAAVCFATEDWIQSGGHTAKGATGKEINIWSTQRMGIRTRMIFRLAPGEYAEVVGHGIGIGSHETAKESDIRNVGAWIEAKEGDVVTFTPGKLLVSFQTWQNNEGRKDSETVWNEIITARLAKEGPNPASEKDRAALLARVSADLGIALPIDEAKFTYENDPFPDAFERLTKRFLEAAKPMHFAGELSGGETKFTVTTKAKDPSDKSDKTSPNQPAVEADLGGLQPAGKIIIQVKADGTFVIQKETQTLKQIEDRLAIIAAVNKQEHITIRAEKQAPNESVVSLLGVCQNLELDQVSLVGEVQPRDITSDDFNIAWLHMISSELKDTDRKLIVTLRCDDTLILDKAEVTPKKLAGTLFLRGPVKKLSVRPDPDMPANSNAVIIELNGKREFNNLFRKNPKASQEELSAARKAFEAELKAQAEQLDKLSQALESANQAQPKNPPAQQPAAQIIIQARPDGTYVIQKEELTLKQLEERLATIAAVNKEQTITIKADKDTSMKFVSKVMQACGKTGLNSISFAELKPDAAELLKAREVLQAELKAQEEKIAKLDKALMETNEVLKDNAKTLEKFNEQQTQRIKALSLSQRVGASAPVDPNWTSITIVKESKYTGPTPKHEYAQALFKQWRAYARADGKIPGALIGHVAEQMDSFLKQHPTDSKAAALAAVRPRLDATHDWTPEDVVKLMDDITEISTAPISWAGTPMEFAQMNKLLLGKPLPEELQKANWGEPADNGLRAAYLLAPSATEYPLNSVIKARVLFHNTGTTPVIFRSETWRQNDKHQASGTGVPPVSQEPSVTPKSVNQEASVTADGRDAHATPINVSSTWYTGMTPIATYRLAPGEYAEVPAHGIAIGAGKYEEEHSTGSVGAVIEATAGQTVRFSSEVNAINEGWIRPNDPKDPTELYLKNIADRIALETPLPKSTADRELLFVRAMQDLFGQPPTEAEVAMFTTDVAPDALEKLTARLQAKPRPIVFSGKLQTGETIFKVLPADPKAATAPRTATGPGRYVLGDKVHLQITQTTAEGKRKNRAEIIFLATNPKQESPHKPHAITLPDKFNFAWQRESGQLWLLKEGFVWRYTFTNEGGLSEEGRYDLWPSTVLSMPLKRALLSMSGLATAVDSHPLRDESLEQVEDVHQLKQMHLKLKPETADQLAWGATVNGLRAALIPMPGAMELKSGAVLDHNVVLQNVSEAAISVRASFPEPSAVLFYKEANGQNIEVQRSIVDILSGMADVKLEPQEIVVATLLSTGIGRQDANLKSPRGRTIGQWFTPPAGEIKLFCQLNIVDPATRALKDNLRTGEIKLRMPETGEPVPDKPKTGDTGQRRKVDWSKFPVMMAEVANPYNPEATLKLAAEVKQSQGDIRKLMISILQASAEKAGELQPLIQDEELKQKDDEYHSLALALAAYDYSLNRNPKALQDLLDDVARKPFGEPGAAFFLGYIDEWDASPLALMKHFCMGGEGASSVASIQFWDQRMYLYPEKLALFEKRIAAAPKLDTKSLQGVWKGNKNGVSVELRIGEKIRWEIRHGEKQAVADLTAEHRGNGLDLTRKSPKGEFQILGGELFPGDAGTLSLQLGADFGEKPERHPEVKDLTLKRIDAPEADQPGTPAAGKSKGAAIKLTPDALIGTWRGTVNGEQLMLSFHRPPAETDVQLDIYFGKATIGVEAGFTIAEDGGSAAVVQHSAGGGMKFGTLIPDETGKLRLELYGRQQGQQEVMMTHEAEADATTPQQKEARALFELWKSQEYEGLIPYWNIDRLADEVRAFVQANPNLDSAAKLQKLLPRFATQIDQLLPQAEAANLLNDVAYYSTKPIEAYLAREEWLKKLTGCWRGELNGVPASLRIRPGSPVDTTIVMDLNCDGSVYDFNFTPALDGVSINLLAYEVVGKPKPFGRFVLVTQDTLRLTLTGKEEGVIYTRKVEPSPTEPKEQAARELFEIWKLNANAGGSIPGTFIGKLASEVRAYAKSHSDQVNAQSIVKLLPRFVASRDWTASEAIKLLDDVAYYSTDPIQTCVGKSKNSTDALEPTKVDLQDIPVQITKWSEPLRGLRIGLHVAGGEWRIGGKVKLALWLHNTSDHDITFDAAPTSVENGVTVTAVDAEGKEHLGHGRGSSRIAVRPTPCTLPAGTVAEVKTFELPFENGNPEDFRKAPKMIGLKPGIYKLTCSWMDAAGLDEGKDWKGTLQTPELEFTLADHAKVPPPQSSKLPQQSRQWNDKYSAVAYQTEKDVDFVLIYEGFISTGLSESYSDTSGIWIIEGNIHLVDTEKTKVAGKNVDKRVIALKHTSDEPTKLYLDGKAYDLGSPRRATAMGALQMPGRIFILRDEGEPIQTNRTLALRNVQDLVTIGDFAARDLALAVQYANSLRVRAMEGWVLGWDEQHSVRHGDSERAAVLRIFADGRVLALQGGRELKEFKIPPNEVATLLRWLAEEQKIGEWKPEMVKAADGTEFERDPVKNMWDRETDVLFFMLDGKRHGIAVEQIEPHAQTFNPIRERLLALAKNAGTAQAKSEPKVGIALQPATEQKLKWGEPANGLRMALAWPPTSGEPALGAETEFYLVVQNASDAPVHFLANADTPNPRKLTILKDGKPLSGLNDPTVRAGDWLLKPREVAFVKLFQPLENGDGKASVSATVEADVRAFPQYSLTAEMSIEKAPEGAWTGKLVTGETRGSMDLIPPQSKDAQALLKAWSNAMRMDGKIPGGLIGKLSESVQTFIKSNPTWATTPQLQALLPRLDATHDWSGQDAVALLNEVSALQETPIQMALEQETQHVIRTGAPLPAELAKAPWGETLANGLRHAWLLEPNTAEHPPGTALKARALIHNAGKEPVTFRIRSWHQLGHKAADAKGAELKTESVEFMTRGILLTYRLAPGEFIEVNSPGIGLGKMGQVEKDGIPVGTWIEAQAGDDLTITTTPIPLMDWNEDEQLKFDGEPRWWLDYIRARLARHLPIPDDQSARERLLYRVAMELFGTPVSAEINAAFVADKSPKALDALAELLFHRQGQQAWAGSLQSGVTKFRVTGQK